MGGTNTKSGLVSSDGKLLWEDTVSTPALAGREALLSHLVNVAERGISRARADGHAPQAIGLATAGWVDPYRGRVVYATDNLPGWTGTAISERLQNECGIPVYVENDANALAVGEAEFGAGRGLTNFVCITLGTGVGGGCWIDGRLRRGAHFFANALGHICIHPDGRACNCGQQGCLEAYANAAALLGYAGGGYASNEALIEAAHRREPAALGAVRVFAHHLAIGCGVLVQLLDPEALILAGGLVQNNPVLLAELTPAIAPRVSVWNQRGLRVIASKLGYHSGVFGAAAVALQTGVV
jgi:glucokinase-like ROK family protein